MIGKREAVDMRRPFWPVPCQSANRYVRFGRFADHARGQPVAAAVDFNREAIVAALVARL